MNLYMNFLSYLGTGMALLIIGLLLFALSTPKIKEFQLIANGNITAAMSLIGKMLGLALVLGAAAEYSVSLIDMAIWGVIGIVSQIVMFFVAELVTTRFSIQQAILDDNRAVGTMLIGLSLSIGWVLAKCLSY